MVTRPLRVSSAWPLISAACFPDAVPSMPPRTWPALTYETLTTKPEQALEAVYEFIGEKPFKHDFNNIEFDAEEFDRRLGTPGLHRVGRRIHSNERRSLLPPELIRKYENDSFWLDPARTSYKAKVS